MDEEVVHYTILYQQNPAKSIVNWSKISKNLNYVNFRMIYSMAKSSKLISIFTNIWLLSRMNLLENSNESQKNNDINNDAILLFIEIF